METSAPHTRAAWGAKVVTELIRENCLRETPEKGQRLPERSGRIERRVSRADLLTSLFAESFTKLERLT